MVSDSLRGRMLYLAKRWLVEDGGQDEVTVASAIALVDQVDQARRDWLAARSYFDNATDPDLVDHAIYTVEAAERKYVYLWKQAKAQGVIREDLFAGTEWSPNTVLD